MLNLAIRSLFSFAAVLWPPFCVALSASLVCPSRSITAQDSCGSDSSSSSIPFFNGSISIRGTASFYYADEYFVFGRAITSGWELFVDRTNVVNAGIRVKGERMKASVSYIEDRENLTIVNQYYSQKSEENEFFFAPYLSTLSYSSAKITDNKKRLLIAASSIGSDQSLGTKETFEYSFSMSPNRTTEFETTFSFLSNLGAR
jgi:hypothetical protein